jgi:hypothetical protein
LAQAAAATASSPTYEWAVPFTSPSMKSSAVRSSNRRIFTIVV